MIPTHAFCRPNLLAKVLAGGAAGHTPAAKTKAVGLVADLMLDQATAAYGKGHDGEEYTSENLAGFDPSLWHTYASGTAMAAMLGKTAEWCSAAAATLGTASPDMQEPLLLTFIGLAGRCKAKNGFDAAGVASVAEKLRVGWVDEYKSDADDFTMNLIHISLSAKDALLKTHASPDDDAGAYFWRPDPERGEG